MLKDEINTIWFSIEKEMKNKGVNTPYIGLNIFVSDGDKLYAMQDYELKQKKYSIMTKGWDWGKYALKREDNRVIIASEPCDNFKWDKISSSIIAISKNSKINFLEEQQ